MIGERLTHFRIVGKLGAGGMGEVYRARDEQLNREVAIKLLPPITESDAEARVRLIREARAAAALNHPSICTIHEIGEAGGRPFIAMELIDGQPLSDLVNGRALPFDDAVRYGIQIAEGLAHAHARHIVHRDLKSSNVMVTADGRAKVLDFGVARVAAGREVGEATTYANATLAGSGAMIGTLAYMAPEQLRGETADARSDVWALGVVLYEMATGARPFHGQSAFDLSDRILNAVAGIPPNVPPSLQAVIAKCLEKLPARRYQTASEAAAALEAVREGTAPRRAFGSHVKRGPVLAAAIVFAFAIAAIALFTGNRWLNWTRGTTPRVQSLAVLPLENLSGDPSQDFFADGMTEVLSTDLGRLGGLKRVSARGSVVRYKSTQKSFGDIARELNVDALVTGSVMRSGNRVSITAQLLDPATGDQLWSNRYERELQDVLTLRNEIVSAIVSEIHAQLSPAERARLTSARRVNPEAFEAYLKGRFHWFKQTREDYDLAERYYQTALEKDPGYAMGYAGLASVWVMRGDAGFTPPGESFPKAVELIAKALNLDDNLPDLHVALGNIKSAAEWNWPESERSYRRALELNPNSADGHFFYGDLLLILQRPAEWERHIQRALELDPLNDFQRAFYGWHLNYLGRYDEAIPVFQNLLARGPNKSSNYLGLWGAYYRKRMYPEAAAAAREFFVSAGDGEFSGTLGDGRDAAAYRAGMRRAADAMIARSSSRHVPALRIARMFAHAGDADAAMTWLEKAYANHESPLMRLGVFWDWIDLRADPRFQDLLKRLKLPA